MTHKTPLPAGNGILSIYSNIFPNFCPFFHSGFWAGKTTLPQGTLSTLHIPGPWCRLEELCSWGKSSAGPSGLLGDPFCNPNVPEGFSIRPRLKKVWSSLRGIARQIQDLLLFKEDTDSSKLPETEQAPFPALNYLPRKVDKSNKDKTNYRDNNSGHEKSRDYGRWEGRTVCQEKRAFRRGVKEELEGQIPQHYMESLSAGLYKQERQNEGQERE